MPIGAGDWTSLTQDAPCENGYRLSAEPGLRTPMLHATIIRILRLLTVSPSGAAVGCRPLGHSLPEAGGEGTIADIRHSFIRAIHQSNMKRKVHDFALPAPTCR
jgi:hypothetical protein